jgi:hypothetical protein
MASNKIIVPGYSQRVFFDNGIEYRNFSGDLVGQQFASNAGTPLFTIANFTITTNQESKLTKTFIKNRFSNFVTMETLDYNDSQIEQIAELSTTPKLKLNKGKLYNHALFGSLTEYLRVSLENIILNFPASLYVRDFPVTSNLIGFTAEDYIFDVVTNKSTFKVNTNHLINKFSINYLDNGNTISQITNTFDLRNLTSSFKNYVITKITNNELEVVDYPIINFTAATDTLNDYIYLEVEGNPFDETTTVWSNKYHIRPNEIQRETFFNSLTDLECELLNRNTTPIYTAKFTFEKRTDSGFIIINTKEYTWNVSDLYNIDFDTPQYITYANDLLDLVRDYDKNKGDLIIRQLTAEAITSFDTISSNINTGDIETLSQKVTKLFRIYGREFDELKRYIDGISLANVVTYNGKDNTPDTQLKYLARTLGWDVISSMVENDLIQNYLKPKPNTYSGLNKGLTAYETEIEIWKRLILNSPWIWKNKGTRKVVEFLIKFIGAPKELIKLNEYIYTAKNKLDVDEFKDILFELSRESDLDSYNVDLDGFPKFHRNTPEMYFQKGGLWYRETGGFNSNVDILEGNNPHLGPYDGGFEYINQLRCLISDFSAVTLVNETSFSEKINLFTNYNSGLVNNTNVSNEQNFLSQESSIYDIILDEDSIDILLEDSPTPTTAVTISIEIVNNDGISVTNCYDVEADIIDDPFPEPELTDCGCETGEGDEAIRISVRSKPTPEIICDFTGFTFEDTGFIIFDTSDGRQTYVVPSECCESIGFTPVLIEGFATYCAWGEITDCSLYIATSPNRNNVMVWQTPGEFPTLTTVVDSIECCNSINYIAVTNPNGEGYLCVESPCEEYEFNAFLEGNIVQFSTPSGLTTIVPYLECCTSQGYDYQQINGTGYECIGVE